MYTGVSMPLSMTPPLSSSFAVLRFVPYPYTTSASFSRPHTRTRLTVSFIIYIIILITTKQFVAEPLTINAINKFLKAFQSSRVGNTN